MISKVWGKNGQEETAVILVTGAAGSAPYAYDTQPLHSHGVYPSSSSQHLRPLNYHSTHIRTVALSPLSRVHHPL